MSQPLCWEFRHEQEENPFRPGSTRPFKVTLHTSSFKDLSPRQLVALDLVRELAPVGEIDLLDTDPGTPRHIRIGERKPGGGGADYVDVTVWENGESRLFTGVSYPDQKLTTACAVVGTSDRSDPRVLSAYSDLLVAAAHRTLNRDLLITESTTLQHPICRNDARLSNARTILEATKVVGLFLRSRDKYVFSAQRRSLLDRTRFDRSLFYLVLARELTPRMWRYVGACHELEKQRNDDSAALSWSALTRCKHALQARDLIGEAFYGPHSDQARDDTEYHFDYLTLLLVGALDAQARIAHRVYGMYGSERLVNFRRPDFLNELRRRGAQQLHSLLTETPVVSFLTLLVSVRNTIHGASLGSHGYHTTGKGPGWIEIAEGELSTQIWESAKSAGGAASWGLTKFRHRLGTDGPLAEPVRLVHYPYGRRLVEEGIRLVDRVAEATEIERAFSTLVIDRWTDAPPDEFPFTADIRNRLAALG